MEHLQHFGHIFRQLRLMRGFRVKDVCHELITPQFLHKFEAGHSDIKLTTFFQLLERIYLTWDEFSLYCKNIPSIEEFRHSLTLLDPMLISGNRLAAIKFVKEYEKKETKNPILAKLITINLKGLIQVRLHESELLSINDIQLAKEHLDKVETWGHFEFHLFTSLLNYFTDDYIIQQLKLIFTKKQRAKLNDEDMLLLANTLISHFLSSNSERLELAEDVFYEALKIYNRLKNPRFLYYKLMLDFYHAILLLKKQQEDGFHLGIRVLKTFDLLGKDYEYLANHILTSLETANTTDLKISDFL